MTDRRTRSARNDDELSKTDVSRFLRQLSKFYSNPKFGNVPLANGLKTAADLLEEYAQEEANRQNQSSQTVAKVGPDEVRKEFDQLTLDQVRSILQRGDLNKSELMELGSNRFAISRSRMKKLNINDALEVIRSAIEHEDSLDIISKEAERGGQSRTS